MQLDLGVKPLTKEEESLLFDSVLLNKNLLDYIKNCIEEGDAFYMIDT